MILKQCVFAFWLAVCLIVVADTLESPPFVHGQPARTPASGALQPTPVNFRFDSRVPDSVLRSDAARAGTIEPPGWELKSGSARPERRGGPSDGSFALLHGGQATLESSPFTISPSTRKLDFNVSYRGAEERPSTLRVYVLSGSGFDQETLVYTNECTCGSEWQKAFAQVAAFGGQTVKLRFVRDRGSSGAVGITDVAADLMQERLGRDRGSAAAGDPVNTSNGNFMESFADIPAIHGRGQPMDFRRYYNSASTHAGSLGPKWTNTYGFSVEPEPDGSRTVRYVDGHTANFSPAIPIVDSVMTATASGNGPLSWTHTTTGAASRLLLVAVSTSNLGGVNSMTYGGQLMQSLTTATSSSRKVSVYFLLNPPSGPNTVAVSLSGLTNGAAAISETFSNVATVAPVATSATGASGSPSVTVPGTSANDLVVDFVAPYNLTPGAGQTTLASANQTFTNIQSSTEPGQSSSVTMSWGTATNWSLVGIRIAGINSSVSTPVVDSVMTATASGNGPITWTHTTTGAPGRLLLVAVSTSSLGGVLAATYAGQSMSPLSTVTSSSRKVSVYYLLNPPSGANTASISLTGLTNGAAAISQTFFNVANVVPAATTATSASGSPSVVIGGTTPSDLVVDFVAPNNLTPGAGQTTLGSATETFTSLQSSTEPGQSPSVTMSWSSATNWALVGVKLSSISTPNAPFLDAVTTKTTSLGPLSWSHTTTGAPGRLLLVAVSTSSTGGVNSITYGGETMQPLSSTTSSSRKVSVYYLINPLSGTNTLTVALTVGTGDASAIAETFSNVPTAVPTAVVANGSSGAPTVTVPGVSANDLIVDFIAPHNLTPNAGQTSLGSASYAFTGIQSSSAAGQSPDVAMSWSDAGGNWAIVGVRIPSINTAVSAPIVDAVTTEWGTGVLSWAHTTTTSPRRLLLVSVATANTGTVSAVSYGGQPMQSLSTATASSRKVSVYYILNPASGTNTVQVNLSVGTTAAAAIAESFSNVATLAPVATAATGANGTPTVTVSGTTADDLVVDFVAPYSLTPGAGQTALGSANQAFNANLHSSTEPAQSPSVTMSWSTTANDWAIIGVKIAGVATDTSTPVVDTVTGAAAASCTDHTPARRLTEGWASRETWGW